jgi:hypothetical protein
MRASVSRVVPRLASRGGSCVREWNVAAARGVPPRGPRPSRPVLRRQGRAPDARDQWLMTGDGLTLTDDYTTCAKQRAKQKRRVHGQRRVTPSRQSLASCVDKLVAAPSFLCWRARVCASVRQPHLNFSRYKDRKVESQLDESSRLALLLQA